MASGRQSPNISEGDTRLVDLAGSRRGTSDPVEAVGEEAEAEEEEAVVEEVEEEEAEEAEEAEEEEA